MILTLIFFLSYLALGQNDIYIGFEDASDALNFLEIINYKYENSHECNGYGEHALGLGPISSVGTSSMKAFVCGGPGTIEFKWRKQSTLADLDFFVDGQKVGYCDPSNANKMEASGPYAIDANKHELVWTYRFNKNNVPTTSSAIHSIAWIDDIHLSGLNFCNQNSEVVSSTIGPNSNAIEIASILNTSSNKIYVLQGANLQTIFDATNSLEKSQKGFNKQFILKGNSFTGNITIRAKNISITSEPDNIYELRPVLDGKWNRLNILLENTSNVTIFRLNLAKSLIGIQLENCTNCRIQDNEIHVLNNNKECSIGLLLWRSSQCEISRNFLKNENLQTCSSSKGIWLIDSYDNIMSVNIFQGFEKYYYIESNSCGNKIFEYRDSNSKETSYGEEECNEWWPYD